MKKETQKKYEILKKENHCGYKVPYGIIFSKEFKKEILTNQNNLCFEMDDEFREITNYNSNVPYSEIWKVFIKAHEKEIEEKIQEKNEFLIIEFYDVRKIMKKLSGVYDDRTKTFHPITKFKSHGGVVINLLGYNSIFELYEHFNDKEKAINFINSNMEKLVVINGNLSSYTKDFEIEYEKRRK